MRIPLSWLKEYVDVSAPVSEIADKLTFSGLQVEEIEVVGSDYKGIVVGEVISNEPHKDSDHLQICVVNDGEKDLTVICGASNFTVGNKVPLATVGAVLPDGTKIKQAKIRGVESFGMMCAEDELGLGSGHAGIMLLGDDLPTGMPFSKVMGPPETVLTLEVTWNRPDCLSVIGVAREVAALYGKKISLPSVKFPQGSSKVSEFIEVNVEDGDLCPRYTARMLQGIEIAPSPLWMTRRLVYCGIRPVNNVVDITNYVLLECGQPLHAFDHSLLAGGEIVVRRARKGEKITTLDGVERKLSSEMLLIADKTTPVALAGVMGGAGTEIKDNTSDVLLESACFYPPNIRGTSSALGFGSESSFRFERGIDVLQTEWASARAALLMVEHAGASVAKGVIDVFSKKPSKKRIKCDYQKTRDLLGVDIKDKEICKILDSLSIEVVKSDDKSCTVVVPPHRRDLEIEADIVEEVARMYGLDNVPELLPSSRVVPDMHDEPARAREALRDYLVGLGLTETMNYSFVSTKLLDIFSQDDIAQRVELTNPISTDHTIMRNSLLPQLVESLGRNCTRQVMNAAFFEMGNTYFKDSKGKICEERKLSLGLMGNVGRDFARRDPVSDEEMFLWLKGIVESLCVSLKSGELTWEHKDHAYYEAGSVVINIDGEEAGAMGLIKAGARDKWRIPGHVAVAELKSELLLKNVFLQHALTPVGTYPAISRDVAFVVPQDVEHKDVMKVIRESAPIELTGIELFDIYTSEGMGESNSKSLAYSMSYRSLDRTLTDEDANRYHEAIKDALKSKLKAEMR